MAFDIVIVICLALVNGFFALSEMALMTSRKSRLKQLARSSRRAQIALALAQTPETFLSTVQLFITLLSVGSGAALGARLGNDVATVLDSIRGEWLVPYAPAAGATISVFAITFINMLLGELAPKRIALVSPERFAIATAIPMRLLTWIALPFAFLLIWLTRLLLRLLRMNRASAEQVSEEEIRLLVSEGAEQGVIDPDERNMVNRVLRLGDRTVDSLMTPRTRIAWLDSTATREENLAVLRSTPFSRYPVRRGSDKDVLGVLEIKNLLDVLQNPQVDFFRKLEKPLFVPATARGMDLLEEFRDAEMTLALVVDEYGDIDGLITLNDLLAAVVGKSAAPLIETQEAPIVQRDDGSWLVSGSLATDDLRELLGLNVLPGQDEHDYRTAAGMMMAHFGRIPQTGEHFDWRDWRFEVVDRDGARIDKILVALRQERTAAEHESG